jgi:hypothetical protein
MRRRHYSLHGERTTEPGLMHGQLSADDVARNKAFLSRVRCIKPLEDGSVQKPAADMRQPAVETREMPDLTPKAHCILSRIIMKPLTPENLTAWCQAHREDGEVYVLEQSRGFVGVGPTSVETALKILGGYGLEVSKPLNLKAPIMAALEQLMGEYPTDRGIRKWAAAHRNDWEDAIYKTFAQGKGLLGQRRWAAVSAVIETYVCESGQAPGATPSGMTIN